MLLLLLSRFRRVRLCATPQTAAHQAPPSLGFSRQEHWSGLPFPSPMRESEKWKGSLSVVSDSSRPHGLQPTRLLHPWDFPGRSIRVGCHCPLRFTVWWSGKESVCQCRRHKRRGFSSWVRKILWRRKWLPILVFLLGKFHGQRRTIAHGVTRNRTWLSDGAQFSPKSSVSIIAKKKKKSCFPWNKGLILLISITVLAKYAPLNIMICLSPVFFFKWKWWCSMTKVACLTHDWNTCPEFFFETNIKLQPATQVLPFRQGETPVPSWYVLKELRSNEINKFYRFVKDTAKWNWFVFSFLTSQWRIQSLGPL